MKIHVETFTLEDGLGRIQLRERGTVGGLYLDGKPLALCWDDNAGSIAQEYWAAGQAVHAGGGTLSDLVAHGPDLIPPLAQQFAPLLKNFVSGDYNLTLEELETIWEFHVLPMRGNSSEPVMFGSFYPLEDRQFIGTQIEQNISEERVQEWISRIDAGQRPVAISLYDGEFRNFVLDGHHKLHAYRTRNIRPWFLTITPTAPSAPLMPVDWPQGFIPTRGFQISIES